jgi:hypothetical protein
MRGILSRSIYIIHVLLLLMAHLRSRNNFQGNFQNLCWRSSSCLSVFALDRLILVMLLHHIVADRYAPLILPHPMNSLLVGHYLNYIPNFTGEEDIHA